MAGVVALYAYFKYLLDWIKGIVRVTAALHCALEQDTLYIRLLTFQKNIDWDLIKHNHKQAKMLMFFACSSLCGSLLI